jgi:hypothetical protein
MKLSTSKVVLILFFDVKGIILQHWVPPGQTVSGNFYATVLRRDLTNTIRKKRLDFPGNIVLPSRQCPLEHPPYSPDLAPYDFWAFSTTKRELRGQNRLFHHLP